jgi:hypothetical protein
MRADPRWRSLSQIFFFRTNCSNDYEIDTTSSSSQIHHVRDFLPRLQFVAPSFRPESVPSNCLDIEFTIIERKSGQLDLKIGFLDPENPYTTSLLLILYTFKVSPYTYFSLFFLVRMGLVENSVFIFFFFLSSSSSSASVSFPPCFFRVPSSVSLSSSLPISSSFSIVVRASGSQPACPGSNPRKSFLLPLLFFVPSDFSTHKYVVFDQGSTWKALDRNQSESECLSSL